MATDRHYNERRLVVCAPQELIDRLDAAAAARLTRRSEYVRQVLLDRLQADKVERGEAAT
jgi:metal-responsive CopG/Arc/MetJ family transcriptional regulator